MRIIKRVFAPKEVKVALDVLDEFGSEFVGSEFDCEAFRMVRRRIEEAFLTNYNSVVSEVKKGVSPRQQVYFAIAALSGYYLESGEYHMYRGVLNPLGIGGYLLKLFDPKLAIQLSLGTPAR